MIFARIPLCIAALGLSAAFAHDLIPLRILLVNGKDSARAAALENLIADHFESVRIVSADMAFASAIGDYDVVVLDAAPQASITFGAGKPFVMLVRYGSGLGQWASEQGSKFRQLSFVTPGVLGMADSLDHPVFQGPEMIAWSSPKEGLKMADGESKYTDSFCLKEFLAGANDTEVILSGPVGTAPMVVREANRLFWGCGADPAVMTADAKNLLINAIVYMTKYEDAKQTDWRAIATREEAIQQWGAVGSTHWTPAILKNNDPKKFVQENYPYLAISPGTEQYDVNPDAIKLGLPVDKLGSLKSCIEFLQKGENTTEASSFLARFTSKFFRTPSEWNEWFESNSDKLHYYDRLGGKWLTGPTMPAPDHSQAVSAGSAIKLPGVSASKPVAAGIALVPQGSGIHEGDVITVVVRVKIMSDWHIYAAVPPDGMFIQSELKVDLPANAEWVGDWQKPDTAPGDDGVRLYEGDMLFTRDIQVTSGKSLKLTGSFMSQACSGQQCMPPDTVNLSVETQNRAAQ